MCSSSPALHVCFSKSDLEIELGKCQTLNGIHYLHNCHNTYAETYLSAKYREDELN